LVKPALKDTEASPEEILVSVIAGLKETPPFNNSAVPPVACPEVMLAVAVKLVLVVFKVLATTVPPTGVKATLVGAEGAILSTVAAVSS